MQNFAFHQRAFNILIYTFNKWTFTVNTVINIALAFCLTIWMKTDKFSQALVTQCNGQQRMHRMIQMELPLWKQMKILPT
jgi:hypothetical protein